jgi:hypothetical protein
MTYRAGAKSCLLDLEPTWTHDFPLHNQQLEGSGVSPKDMAERGSASPRRYFGFYMISNINAKHELCAHHRTHKPLSSIRSRPLGRSALQRHIYAERTLPSIPRSHALRAIGQSPDTNLYV